MVVPQGSEKNPHQRGIGHRGTFLDFGFRGRRAAFLFKRLHSQLSRLSFRNGFGIYHDGRHRSHRFRHSPQYALLAGVYALAGRHGDTRFHACDFALSGRGELSADEVRVPGTAGGQARQQGAADGNDSLRHLFRPDSPRMDPLEMRRYGLVQFADHLHEHGGNGRVCRHGGKRQGISQRLYGYRRHDLHAGIQRQFQSLLSRYSGKDRQCFEGRGISLLFFIRISCDIRRHIG